MAIIRSWMQRVCAVPVTLCACAPSGEVTQPVVEEIPLVNSDLRDMAFDKQGVNAEPKCLYVSDANQNQVHCVDLKLRGLDANAAITGMSEPPAALALSRGEGRTLYIGSAPRTGGGTLYTVDLDAPTKVDPVATSPSYSNNIDALRVLSNGVVAVGLQDAAIKYYPSATGSSPQLPVMSDFSRVVTANDSGKWFVWRDVENDPPMVSIWSIGSDPINEVIQGPYFGFDPQAPPSIVFRPAQRDGADEIFYVLSDGGGGNQSAIPGYRLEPDSKKATALETQLTANYPAVALAFSKNLQRILVAHDDEKRKDYRYEPNHDLSVPDLHVFDAGTGAEVGVIALPDHVHDRGIAVAPDGTIYLLLGRAKATRIGVIRDPGN